MAHPLKRLSVALDHRLLAEARRLTRSRSKRATIAKALEELVKLERRKALLTPWVQACSKPLRPNFVLAVVVRMLAVDLSPRLVDTSVWIRADRKGHETLKNRLKELVVADFVLIRWPIRSELLIGVKTMERWEILDEQLAALEQVPMMESTWSRAARLGHMLGSGRGSTKNQV